MIPSWRMVPCGNDMMVCIHTMEVFCKDKMIYDDDGVWLVVPVRAPSNANHVIIGSCNNG